MHRKKDIEGSLVRLADKLYLVPGRHNGRYPFCNGFLIVDEVVAFIDAGVGLDRLTAIDDVYHIDRLVISHSHPDHFLYWHVLTDRELMMPAETPDSITDLLEMGIRFTGNADDGAYWQKVLWGEQGIKPLRIADRRYRDGDVLDFGKTGLHAVHVPGHLSDHYCFFEPQSGYLLSTDIDFDGFGPWYGNPESSPSEFRNHILQVMQLPYSNVCCSHKPPMERESARAAFEVFVNKFEEHQQIVLALCDAPVSLEDLAVKSPFYQDRLPDKRIQLIFDRLMTKKNLDLLLERGEIVESDGRYCRK